MTTTAETLSLLAERLTPLLERARAASARRAAPVLASLSIELDAAAPPCLAARAHFLWEQPPRPSPLPPPAPPPPSPPPPPPPPPPPSPLRPPPRPPPPSPLFFFSP